MLEVRFLDPALQELQVVASFYGDLRSKHGFTFLEEFERIIDHICSAPGAARPISGGLRRIPLRRFPYTVFYKEEDSSILIVSVFHQHRRPDSWRENY